MRYFRYVGAIGLFFLAGHLFGELSILTQIGERRVLTADVVDYYDHPLIFLASFPSLANIGVGYRWPVGFSFEGNIGMAIRGQHGTYNGTQPIQIDNRNSYSFELMPGWTWDLPLKFFRKQPTSLFAGISAGPHLLELERKDFDAAGNETGMYELHQINFGYGVHARFDMPVYRWLAFYVEGAYVWDRYTDAQIANATGIYVHRSSPELTVTGSPAYFDFSGPQICLGIRFSPFRSSN